MQQQVVRLGLPEVDRRIAKLIETRPRHWNKRLKILRKMRKTILAQPRPDKLVKGWKSAGPRKARALKMKKMHKNKTYAEIGRQFGLSRQRVHQIVSRWK